jgi:hypothetical protein
MFWKNKRCTKVKQNELRITEVINGLGEKSYSIEKYRMWGYHASMWFDEKTGIDTYENAIKLKSEIEKQILKDTIVKVNVL